MGYEQKMILINPYMEKPQTVIHLDNFQLSKNRVINGGFAVYHHIYLEDKGRTKKRKSPRISILRMGIPKCIFPRLHHTLAPITFLTLSFAEQSP